MALIKLKKREVKKQMSVIRIQSDSLETRLEIVRVGVWDLFKQNSTDEKGVNIGIIATFGDAVIVKDYDAQKMYELKYLILDNKISFEDPKEVDNVYVTKQLMEANPEITLKDMEILIDSWKDYTGTFEEFVNTLKGKDRIDNPEALCAWMYYEEKGEWPEEKIAMKSKKFIELTGPIVYKNVKKRIAYAAVLVPGEEDSDGEIVSKAKVEDAAHEWMEDYQHIDLKHSLNSAGKPVECYLTYSERTVKALDGEELVLPEGTWILASKLDEKVFESVEKGELTGYSVMGVKRRALKEKDLKKALKSFEDDPDILKVLKKTLLKDLGPDWVPVAVGVVPSAAVPKSKWFALKSKVIQPKESLWDRIVKTFKRGQKKSKIKIIVKAKKIKEWTKDKAKKWLKEHKFKYGNYEEMANYHAFRQENPDKYKEFRTTKTPFDFKEKDGVIVVYGILIKDKKRTVEIQSIKFYRKKEVKKSKSIIKLI